MSQYSGPLNVHRDVVAEVKHADNRQLGGILSVGTAGN